MSRPLAFILAAMVFIPSLASGQDVVAPGTPEQFQLPDLGDILPLHRGTAAPRDGLLIDADDLLQIRQEYERMRYLLMRTTERDTQVCDVRVQVEHAHTEACGERLTLRDDLWGARQHELVQQIADAQQRANQAAQRQWYDQPILYLIIGAAVVGLIWIATAVR